jgi:methylmalonyl-CoA/ethylmalonyl-CoA epimerase
MFKNLDHIGIAVKNIDEAARIYRLLGLTIESIEVVENQYVKTAHIKTNSTYIELLEPINESSPVYKFIQKKGEGLHHIAFHVEDVYKSIEILKKEGFTFTTEEPIKGAHNRLAIFIHPKNTNSTLIELLS